MRRSIPLFIASVLMKLFFFYRLWICTFTLAVSGGAVLLLPMSIVANEVLLIYPKSYYLQWVNTSLIQGQYRRYSGPKRYSDIVLYWVPAHCSLSHCMWDPVYLFIILYFSLKYKFLLTSNLVSGCLHLLAFRFWEALKYQVLKENVTR